MKELTTAACLLIAAAACSETSQAEQAAVSGAPDLVFDTTSYDFGTVSAGAVAEHAFHFTNRGDTALELQQPKGS